MSVLWWRVQMLGGPLDGAAVCVPCRDGRVDNWVWVHECLVWDGERAEWVWSGACVSGFYQLAETAGVCEVDVTAVEPSVEVYRWRDIRLAGTSLGRWEFGD